MKIYILASLILLGLVIYRASRLQKKQKNSQEKEFWDREEQANNIRRKSLDFLDYITIPVDTLPLLVLQENEAVAKCVETIQQLSHQKIVNLTGITNTDLKLEYGTANLTILSEYDQNYTLLVRTLQEWAEALYKEGYVQEAKAVLEFAVSTHTDISNSYYLLAEIYASTLDYSKIEQLLTVVAALRSANRQAIARTLQATYL